MIEMDDDACDHEDVYTSLAALPSVVQIAYIF